MFVVNIDYCFGLHCIAFRSHAYTTLKNLHRNFAMMMAFALFLSFAHFWQKCIFRKLQLLLSSYSGITLYSAVLLLGTFFFSFLVVGGIGLPIKSFWALETFMGRPKMYKGKTRGVEIQHIMTLHIFAETAH